MNVSTVVSAAFEVEEMQQVKDGRFWIDPLVDPFVDLGKR